MVRGGCQDIAQKTLLLCVCVTINYTLVIDATLTFNNKTTCKKNYPSSSHRNGYFADKNITAFFRTS